MSVWKIAFLVSLSWWTSDFKMEEIKENIAAPQTAVLSKQKRKKNTTQNKSKHAVRCFIHSLKPSAASFWHQRWRQIFRIWNRIQTSCLWLSSRYNCWIGPPGYDAFCALNDILSISLWKLVRHPWQNCRCSRRLSRPEIAPHCGCKHYTRFLIPTFTTTRRFRCHVLHAE